MTIIRTRFCARFRPTQHRLPNRGSTRRPRRFWYSSLLLRNWKRAAKLFVCGWHRRSLHSRWVAWRWASGAAARLILRVASCAIMYEDRLPARSSSRRRRLVWGEKEKNFQTMCFEHMNNNSTPQTSLWLANRFHQNPTQPGDFVVKKSIAYPNDGSPWLQRSYKQSHQSRSQENTRVNIIEIHFKLIARRPHKFWETRFENSTLNSRIITLSSFGRSSRDCFFSLSVITVTILDPPHECSPQNRTQWPNVIWSELAVLGAQQAASLLGVPEGKIYRMYRVKEKPSNKIWVPFHCVSEAGDIY